MPGPTYIGNIGVYIPPLRLTRASIAAATSWLNPGATAIARGARAICNWDEDAVTMAVEAGRGLRGAMTPGRLLLASTTLPFVDRSQAALVAAALDLDAQLQTQDAGGTLRAGTSALLQAAQSNVDQDAWVIATDARVAQPGSGDEMRFGHAAVALQLSSQSSARNSPIATLLGAASLSENFVDHYRGSEAEFNYTLEERWVRDSAQLPMPPRAIAAALKSAGVDAATVQHIAMPGATALVRKIAERCGMKHAVVVDNLHADCGDSGVAHPLLLLASVLERANPGEHIAVIGFGQGVDALIFRVESGVMALRAKAPIATALAKRREESQYLRYLSHAGLVNMDFGMRAERDQRTAHSVAWRKHRMLDAFVGGQCKACNTVQFPLSRVCANPDCRVTDQQQPYALAESKGHLKTFTEDWQAYSPRPPYVYGNVAFEPGGNLLMELTDVAPGELTIGDALRFVFRVKDIDRARGFRRYFWKAVRA